jgi:cysteinyl-tRNA synthetase
VSLVIYNSLTGKKEPFVPIRPGKIGMYVCGITIYDHCHLGHARLLVNFDVIVRFLRSQAFEVTYVRNITDIDDKIIARALERAIPINELTAYFIDAMNVDATALFLLSPDIEPRATQHIDGIVALIKRLIEQGHAYVSDNGDVCFEVSTFGSYGKLSHKDMDNLLAGARVDIVKEKRSPLDFVLWKSAKANEPSWPSPWGAGRPGWHIECSAMAMEELGEQFDIHGGGLDLKFPHHENEIAQSEACTGKPLANYWMHAGLLQFNNEKMAKSTGNFLTIQEALTKHHPEVIRYFLLSSHYRSPLNYTEDNITLAESALVRFYQSIKGIELLGAEVDDVWVDRFNEAMSDDFNTPEALAVLFQLSRELNKNKSAHYAYTLKHLLQTLGLMQESPEVFFQRGMDVDSTNVITQLIEERLCARQNREWQRADLIRDELQKLGVELEDNASGTTWKYKA